MGRAINGRELRRQYDSLGADRTCRLLTEALDAKQVKADDFSVRELFENLVDDGPELLRAMSFRKSGGLTSRKIAVMEAGGAIDTGAFVNITGQLLFNKIKEGYENPEFLWPDLCETVKTEFLDGERIPGIGGMGDKFEQVLEGNPYPTIGTNEEYIDTPQTAKRGAIIPITREIIVADRTGILLKRAGEGGHYMGINKEKRVIDAATGQTNTYKRNGTATNTYLTSGAYVNSTSNTLIDWRSIETAELLFDAMTDPNTGEPIIMKPDVLLVPSALKKTALRVLGATEIAQVDNQANSSTVRAFSPNPSPFYGGTYKVLSNAYVKARTGSASTWFIGDFKRAFYYMEVWGIETLQAASNSEAEFVQDIITRIKISERGVPAVVEPRFVAKNT